MQPMADNFDPTANYDDGSCFFANYGEGLPDGLPESVQYTLGCLDPQSMSYNPNADYDDGNQCIYIGGCLNPNAVNYNEEAQYDDGSCVF